jgi:hypothetical protein
MSRNDWWPNPVSVTLGGPGILERVKAAQDHVHMRPGHYVILWMRAPNEHYAEDLEDRILWECRTCDPGQPHMRTTI